MELGQKLKDARTKAGWKQEDLAKELGVSRQTLSNWENNRSLPDVGSAVKLSSIFNTSLDEMLRSQDDIVRTFQNITQRRRKFWQMMLEIGIILDLLSSLLAGQGFRIPTYLTLTGAIVLTYVSIFMHLRVFDHDRGEILRGLLGLFLHGGCNLLLCLEVGTLILITVRLVALCLIWSAGVFTIDRKSTRLWLIIALYIGSPLLTVGTAMQESGALNTANPFGKDYQVEQILFPSEMSLDAYTKISLSGSWMYFEDREGNRETIGSFSYLEPVEGQSQQGIWQLIPKENPDALYKLTVEADGEILLSCYGNEQLVWKWQLAPYGRNTCFLTVATLGSTMQTVPTWYAPGRSDPEPYLKLADVAGRATMTLAVGGLDTEALPLLEEYHHGYSVEYAQYTIHPEKNGTFRKKLETRYDGEEEWALYRIPFEDGEYRFILVYQ